jgi:DNA-directed RNA polymerase sigma subunit (sigma70/sigma32)
VIELRHLNARQRVTLAQVGRRIKRSPERVRQIEQSALKKLRADKNLAGWSA